MTYYVGNNPQDVLGGLIKRYFYGLRRNEDGELFFTRVDQLGSGEDNQIVVNELGVSGENFPDFEEGIDFTDGIDENHDIVYDNLRYQQFKWDNRNILYYIDDNGQLSIRISEAYVYPDGISSDGY